jgi:hypothetical protein
MTVAWEYKLKAQLIEPVFGNTKHNRQVARFRDDRSIATQHCRPGGGGVLVPSRVRAAQCVVKDQVPCLAPPARQYS